MAEIRRLRDFLCLDSLAFNSLPELKLLNHDQLAQAELSSC